MPLVGIPDPISGDLDEPFVVRYGATLAPAV